jgi:hypothetical protein
MYICIYVGIGVFGEAYGWGEGMEKGEGRSEKGDLKRGIMRDSAETSQSSKICTSILKWQK